MAHAYHPPRCDLSHLVFIALGPGICRPLVRFMYRLQVEREPGWDLAAPCLLAANHRSFMDPPICALALRRPLSFFARENLWRLPVIRQFLNALGGIPIDRTAPAATNLLQVVRWLRSGRRILVFPEGTRTRTGRVGRLQRGPAMFARRAGVPLVPVYLHRTETAWPRGWPVFAPTGKVLVRFGSPLRPRPDLDGRQADEEMTARLQAWMEARERELYGPA